MKLPKLEKPEKYVGLYVVDFGDTTGVGFTAEEVAELFESEMFRDCKAYKIHKAYPDGRLELKGVRREIFQLEAGMLFYAGDIETARADYKRLVKSGVETDVPCRAKINLAKFSDDKYAVALIYPAEYDDEVSGWLLEHNYKTAGQVEGGASAVTQYYKANPEIIERHQLWPSSTIESRSGEELLAATKMAIQR
ncbi:MAG: hypothetical protein ABSB91_10050 [Sedimentisphaerales bacterium]